jgi:hypothetical protein
MLAGLFDWDPVETPSGWLREHDNLTEGEVGFVEHRGVELAVLEKLRALLQHDARIAGYGCCSG